MTDGGTARPLSVRRSAHTDDEVRVDVAARLAVNDPHNLEPAAAAVKNLTGADVRGAGRERAEVVSVLVEESVAVRHERERLAGSDTGGSRMPRRRHPVAGEAELVRTHADIAYRAAGRVYLPGADKSDVQQEALIGLLVAARDYDGSTPFRHYATVVVVRRWLISAIKRHNRLRQNPLTQAVRWGETDEGEPIAVTEVLPGGRDPVDVLIERERVDAVRAAFRELSPLEREWLVHAANGGEYASNQAGRRNKQAENAVDRARAKLRRAAA